MAPVIDITESEVFDAIAEASRGSAPKDARTADELSQAIGCSSSAIHKALKALHRAGRLQVHHVARTRIDGRRCSSPAYTVTPAKRKK
jgi:predicted transcriptional regulator